jgi:hypothetical protein
LQLLLLLQMLRLQLLGLQLLLLLLELQCSLKLLRPITLATLHAVDRRR